MSDSLSLIVKTVDRTRKSAVTLPSNLKIERLVSRLQQEWQLPTEQDYSVRLERTGKELDLLANLASAGVQNDDVLEILPIIYC